MVGCGVGRDERKEVVAFAEGIAKRAVVSFPLLGDRVSLCSPVRPQACYPSSGLGL